MYVYVIADKSNKQMVKVGYSKHPEKRLSELQVGSPCKLRMVGTIRCEDDYKAQHLERYMHKLYYKHRRHGEWFHLSKKRLAGLMKVLRITEMEL